MIETYLVECEFTIKGKTTRDIVETQIGRTKADAVDQIILGQYEDRLRRIYRVALDQPTEDVTDEIAKEVWEYGMTHDLCQSVLGWLDWCGYDYQEAAE